jgi:group I intron endonuclease
MAGCHLYSLDFPNGKRYVGISQNIRKRHREHRAIQNKKPHLLLAKAILKYGLPPMRILCVGERPYIASLEIKAISAFQTRDHKYGYNISFGGDGGMQPPEVRAKTGAALKGRKFSEERLANFRDAMKAKIWTFSPEHREKIRAKSKGRSPSLEARAKLSAIIKGRPVGPHSAEHRAKIGDANRRRIFTAEMRANMRAAHQKRSHLRESINAKISATLTGRPGKPITPEIRAKISAANKGRIKSPETCAKISAAKKGCTPWNKRTNESGM